MVRMGYRMIYSVDMPFLVCSAGLILAMERWSSLCLYFLFDFGLLGELIYFCLYVSICLL